MPAPSPHAELALPLRIGWKGYLDLPELGLRRVKSKIDTGARTSTLHVQSLRGATSAAGEEMADVVFCPDRHDSARLVAARVRILRHVLVTDSGGHREMRPLIGTDMVLGPLRKQIFVPLTDRSDMLFRMILGRKALEGDFYVDPSGKYL